MPKKVGRKPINEPDEVDAIELKIQAYFDKLTAGDDTAKPPTFNGLALALGYNSRTSLWENSNSGKPISEPIKKAMAKIEEAYEERLFSQSPTGAIFALKNRGWKDRQEVEHSGGISIIINDDI
jgi:hypothetical protein